MFKLCQVRFTGAFRKAGEIDADTNVERKKSLYIVASEVDLSKPVEIERKNKRYVFVTEAQNTSFVSGTGRVRQPHSERSEWIFF
jgi:hypothetical protein